MNALIHPAPWVNWAIALALVSTPASAQTLPPSSRTVYKCEEGNKVRYSDAPCLGAKKVDVEPTRGLNKSTGRERTGNDVQREKYNELMADAMRPLLNETPEQRAVRHKRFNLEPSAKMECARLDAQIPRLEAEERAAKDETLKRVQQGLLTSRTRFHQLRC